MGGDDRDGEFLRLLRSTGLIAAAAGAAGSIAFMLYAGRRNPSRLLVLLFAIWVLSPFAALLSIDAISKRWSPVTRSAVYGLMWLLAVVSPAAYGYIAVGPPRPQAAFMFVVLPPLSWLVGAAVLAMAAFISSRRAHPGSVL